jgi:hypothetical protein
MANCESRRSPILRPRLLHSNQAHIPISTLASWWRTRRRSSIKTTKHGAVSPFGGTRKGTDYYAFVVDAKDAFAVLRFKNDEPTELVGWTKNDAIKPVTMLRVVAAKGHVTCFANDVQVSNLTIGSGSGSVGFVVWQDQSSGTSFDFDDFVVIDPNASKP